MSELWKFLKWTQNETTQETIGTVVSSLSTLAAAVAALLAAWPS